jgi:hypothetical protein
MQGKELFQVALGLLPPWLVKDCTFERADKWLNIFIDFMRGA